MAPVTGGLFVSVLHIQMIKYKLDQLNKVRDEKKYFEEGLQ